MSRLDQKPQIGKEVFIAPNATVIGDVILGDESSVWFGAVLRGDTDTINVGYRTNIQDTAVVHADPGAPAHIGHDVVVGHGAIVHGAYIGNHTLIGMRSTVLNHAKVGDYCIIGAHALVPEGMEIPDYSLVMGVPAKVVKQLTETQVEKIKLNAASYVALAEEYPKA